MNLLMIILIAAGALMVLLFIPLKGRRYRHDIPVRHVDERDTMFSRNELVPGTDRYKEYYSRNPDNLEKDNLFREAPGLLNERARFYNVKAFASAHASFELVTAFYGYRKDRGVADEKNSAGRDNPTESIDGDAALTSFLKIHSRKMGAVNAGVALMMPYHYYTIGGRREGYGVNVNPVHRYGIAFTVEMDSQLVSTAPRAGIVMESAHEYLQSGMIATQLAVTLRNLGYSATTHIDGNYDVICPLVARDAGLGEIGRMGLLMTPALGPRVRIAVVTTDAPLVPDTPVRDNSVIDFCTHCSKCARVCPSASIPEGEREEMTGGLRWKINQESCYTYWCKAGTDCGRCMAVCPYSHPDNNFHNFIRWGIRNNFIFRRVAVWLDDLFYGRIPGQGKMPRWLSD
jgi:reductive dehalogenase